MQKFIKTEFGINVGTTASFMFGKDGDEMNCKIYSKVIRSGSATEAKWYDKIEATTKKMSSKGWKVQDKQKLRNSGRVKSEMKQIFPYQFSSKDEVILPLSAFEKDDVQILIAEIVLITLK